MASPTSKKKPPTPTQTQMNLPRAKTRQNFFGRSTMTPILPYLSRADLSNLARSHFNLSVLLRERDMWSQALRHEIFAPRPDFGEFVQCPRCRNTDEKWTCACPLLENPHEDDEDDARNDDYNESRDSTLPKARYSYDSDPGSRLAFRAMITYLGSRNALKMAICRGPQRPVSLRSDSISELEAANSTTINYDESKLAMEIRIKFRHKTVWCRLETNNARIKRFLTNGFAAWEHYDIPIVPDYELTPDSPCPPNACYTVALNGVYKLYDRWSVTARMIMMEAPYWQTWLIGPTLFPHRNERLSHEFQRVDAPQRRDQDISNEIEVLQNGDSPHRYNEVYLNRDGTITASGHERMRAIFDQHVQFCIPHPLEGLDMIEPPGLYDKQLRFHAHIKLDDPVTPVGFGQLRREIAHASDTSPGDVGQPNMWSIALGRALEIAARRHLTGEPIPGLTEYMESRRRIPLHIHKVYLQLEFHDQANYSSSIGPLKNILLRMQWKHHALMNA